MKAVRPHNRKSKAVLSGLSTTGDSKLGRPDGQSLNTIGTEFEPIFPFKSRLISPFGNTFENYLYLLLEATRCNIIRSDDSIIVPEAIQELLVMYRPMSEKPYMIHDLNSMTTLKPWCLIRLRDV